MINKVKEIQKKIERLLREEISFRDDDKLLVANFWYGQMLNNGINPKKVTAQEFLSLYANDHITNSDIITRARRKAEEEKPELRGKTWYKRHSEEEFFRNNINK